MSKTHSIHFLNADDWTALYVDGKLVDENHSLDEFDVLERVIELLEIDASLSSEWKDDEWWEQQGNRAPEFYLGKKEEQ